MFSPLRAPYWLIRPASSRLSNVRTDTANNCLVMSMLHTNYGIFSSCFLSVTCIGVAEYHTLFLVEVKDIGYL